MSETEISMKRKAHWQSPAARVREREFAEPGCSGMSTVPALLAEMEVETAKKAWGSPDGRGE